MNFAVSKKFFYVKDKYVTREYYNHPFATIPNSATHTSQLSCCTKKYYSKNFLRKKKAISRFTETVLYEKTVAYIAA